MRGYFLEKHLFVNETKFLKTTSTDHFQVELFTRPFEIYNDESSNDKIQLEKQDQDAIGIYFFGNRHLHQFKILLMHSRHMFGPKDL